jgi:hypothetical protein
MVAKLASHHERMMASMDSQLEKMEAYLGKTEDMNLEANPEEMKSEAENEEVLKEEATVKTFRVLKERYRDRYLVIRSRGQLKKQTQGNCGSRKKLAAVCRWLT